MQEAVPGSLTPWKSHAAGPLPPVAMPQAGYFNPKAQTWPAWSTANTLPSATTGWVK